MKAGIVTFHRAINYGALLQGYALKSAIEKLGHTAEIVDYRCPVLEAPYAMGTLGTQKGIKNKIRYMLRQRTDRAKRANFEKFLNGPLGVATEGGYTAETVAQANERYDCFFTGSDQVFNPDAHGFDVNYFLDFVREDSKKFSYAASFGVSKLSPSNQEKIGKLLSSFACCSVREQQGIDLLSEFCDRPARMDVDPVFLLTKEEWRQHFDLKKTDEKYVLMYYFELDEAQIAMARACHNAGYKVKHVGKPLRKIFDFPCEYIGTAGPQEFLQLFYGASFVITNSFHGTAFSINFGCPMAICLLKKGNKVNSRLENIIRLTGLESRMMDESTDPTQLLELTVDWQSVTGRLEELRTDSYNYLKECFDKCQKSV